MCAEVVGRDAELHAITRFLDSLTARRQVLVVEGEAGIGKTTLWLAALDHARQCRFRVLSCRPSAAEARLSYASVADLLEADVDDEVLDALPDPQRRAIDFVLLRAPVGAAVTDHRAVGAAVLSILGQLAEDAPVLLAIDDLQWTDGSSIRAVEFALRRLSTRPGSSPRCAPPRAATADCRLRCTIRKGSGGSRWGH